VYAIDAKLAIPRSIEESAEGTREGVGGVLGETSSNSNEGVSDIRMVIACLKQKQAM